MTLTVEDVRKYMHDNPISNLKYNDKFFSDENIASAITDARERANQMPPLGTSSQSPDYIIRYGAIGILFEQKYINAVINYNPGIYENGLHVPVGEEAQLYQNLSNFYLQRFAAEVKTDKVAANTLSAMTTRNAGSSWFRDTGLNRPNRPSSGVYNLR